ncbi:uncharacterized protein K489DRAFT_326901, partial [Dissoconium aciculare CBS 342.82]|uniref:C2H2-type domain-containing protein n=1 Tax=Dissoconium aciculare CBS 342.82 TaxID=1314786 RepID=A0A6J3LSK7_9PEZI
MASAYFEHESEWQLAICRECRVAVWPAHIMRHLQSNHHRVEHKEAQRIAEEVQTWPGLALSASQLILPSTVRPPIEALPIYQDGIQCCLEPESCRYVCRSIGTIRRHWRRCHQWSRQGRQSGGGSGSAKTQKIAQAGASACRPVHCQRFFAHQECSGYFEVCPRRQTDDATPATSPDTDSAAAASVWMQAWKQANEALAAAKRGAEQRIAEGNVDEANPWLRRTGWVPYLAGQDREVLVQLVEEPTALTEKLATAVWQVMADVATASQATVAGSGTLILMQAVRTERDQVRYQPLQPYQDRTSIRKRCRVWQQMLVFFVRTQRMRDAGRASGPEYRFNRRQAVAFERLMAAAEDVVAATGEEASPENAPLTSIQRACLDFCIELLNQTVSRREYDCALICAAAVLGVNPTQPGWRDPETYPPFLSAIIK